jgi:hypothetical protein
MTKGTTASRLAKSLGAAARAAAAQGMEATRLGKECKANGGHTRSGETDTYTLGGVPTLLERCAHCRVFCADGWKAER